MRKLIMVLAMLAILALVAIPAIAQVTGEFGQETDDTGSVALETAIESTGDSSNQCVAPIQFGNTGNLQNLQGFLQYDSTVDDVEFENDEQLVFAPEQSVVCGQSVEQAAAASSY